MDHVEHSIRWHVGVIGHPFVPSRLQRIEPQKLLHFRAGPDMTVFTPKELRVEAACVRLVLKTSTIPLSAQNVISAICNASGPSPNHVTPIFTRSDSAGSKLRRRVSFGRFGLLSREQHVITHHNILVENVWIPFADRAFVLRSELLR